MKEPHGEEISKTPRSLMKIKGRVSGTKGDMQKKRTDGQKGMQAT
jgi:hypothetical protein